MTLHSELTSILPLRNVPFPGALFALFWLSGSVLSPLSLWMSGGATEDDWNDMLLRVPVFGVIGLYWLFRAWQDWTALTLDGDQLVWRGAGATHRFPPEAVVELNVDLGHARRRLFWPATFSLALSGPGLPDAVQIGKYRFVGASLFKRSYRLAHALGVDVFDPTGVHHRTRSPLPLRWLGEGRDWLVFALLSAVVGPVLAMVTLSLRVVALALMAGLIVSLMTLFFGGRPLDLDRAPPGRKRGASGPKSL